MASVYRISTVISTRFRHIIVPGFAEAGYCKPTRRTGAFVADPLEQPHHVEVRDALDGEGTGRSLVPVAAGGVQLRVKWESGLSGNRRARQLGEVLRTALDSGANIRS